MIKKRSCGHEIITRGHKIILNSMHDIDMLFLYSLFIVFMVNRSMKMAAPVNGTFDRNIDVLVL